MSRPYVDVSSPILKAYFDGLAVRQREIENQQQNQIQQEQLKLQNEQQERLRKQGEESLKLQREAQQLAMQRQQKELDLRALDLKSKNFANLVNLRGVPPPDNQQERLGAELYEMQGMLQPGEFPRAQYTKPLNFLGSEFSPEELQTASGMIGKIESDERRVQQANALREMQILQQREIAERNVAQREAAADQRHEAAMARVDATLARQAGRGDTLEKELTRAQRAAGIRSLADSTFRGEAYKAYRERLESLDFVTRVLDDPKFVKGSAALTDLALGYAFARGMDPNRVSDQELAQAIKNAMAGIEAGWLKVQRFFKKGPMFDNEARRKIQALVRERRNAARAAYAPHRKSVAYQLKELYGQTDEQVKEILQDDFKDDLLPDNPTGKIEILGRIK